MSDTGNAVLCDCVCHLRGDGCKEVAPLQAQNKRLLDRIERMEQSRAQLRDALHRHREAVVVDGRGDDAHMDLWQEAGVPDPLTDHRTRMPDQVALRLALTGNCPHRQVGCRKRFLCRHCFLAVFRDLGGDK